MSRISTKLTKLLGVRTPVVCGAMAVAGGGRLAAQATLGGGFGFIGAGYGGVDKIRAEADIARSLLKKPSQSTLPIGIGYLGWQLEAPGAPALDFLDVALEYKVQAVWLSFGERIEQWIAHIRSKEPAPGSVKIFVQVSTVEQAVRAVQDWKVDALVVQGCEAGGHGFAAGSSMMTILSETLAVIPKDGPPVLAAGGLIHGGHLAAVLTLGASGGVFGTRFLASRDSLYSDRQRQALIAAKGSASVRSMAFDHVRNTLNWPAGTDARGLRNSLVDGFEKGIEIDILRSRFAEGTKEEDPDRMIVWAGAGIGLVNRLQSAAEVVEEINEECIQKLRTSTLLLEKPEAKL